MRNHEITAVQKLLNEKGNIREPGWARHPYWQYDRKDIKAPAFRIKEWDYYLVIHDGKYDGTESFAAAFTLSDDGYIGLQSVSLLHLDEGDPHEHTQTVLNVFPMGKMNFPKTPEKGDVSYEDERLKLYYRKKEKERTISCFFRDFEPGKDLQAEISLAEPQQDSLVIATPWDQNRHFYYNSKINCLAASGYIEYDGKSYLFDPEHDYGTLDWGRGVWTYDNTWYWGNGNATIDGHRFGFNIGYGFGNTSAASENILFLDGVGHKLDDVDFGIPNDPDPKAMDGPGYMEEWQLTSSDGRFQMSFRPILDRFAKLDYKAIVSDQHQVFGRMSGTVILDNGETLEIKDLLCFCEKVHNRY
ncbi:MAG: DUF2804 domain-containing protein [Erysipelotrichaceae bacterium]|nr:DUF2804 domain-containing protein [Erysipelotrichaceae bacterium]